VSDLPPSPWSIPAFRRWLVVRASTAGATQIVGTAVGWQVYDLTGDPLDLGFVGLSVFIPTLLLWPLTGLAADRFPRRDVVRGSLAIVCLGTLGLLAVARAGASGAGPIFALMALMSVGRVFGAPAGQSLVAGLVPTATLGAALSLTSAVFQAASLLGPALAGLLIAVAGLPACYAVSSALLVLALGLTWGLPPCRGGGARRGWADVVEGLRFLRGQPVLLSAITLDLFVVLLGGATALLPVYAADVLAVGPEGLGLLRAAPAVGAVLMALWLARRPPRRRVGRTLLAAVAVFGLATLGFGLSTTLLPALAFLGVLGAADEVSVMLRQTLIQVQTPDALRGRIAAVNSVFVGISNEIGELESGLLAAAVGPVRAVVLGGLGSLAVVAGFWAWARPLREVDTLEPPAD